MEVRLEADGAATVIRLIGDLDSRTASDTLEQVVALFEGHQDVVLDLSQVPYISSAGLRTMLLLHRHALGRSISMTVVGLSDELRSLLSATGLLRFFTVGSEPVPVTPEGGAR
jgi:anti-sigma B factor antagonist